MRAVWCVDDQLELARLHDRQVRRLRALKDAADIDADLPPRVCNVGSVAHQPADFGNFTGTGCHREPHGAPSSWQVAPAGW